MLKLKSVHIKFGNDRVEAGIDDSDPNIEIEGTEHFVEAGLS